jgi:RNA polymerase sigma-70 factor, ECF subfamily
MGSPRAESDAEVERIRRAQNGDHEAFEELVASHERRVFGLVFRLVRNRNDLEDIVQEVFLKAFLAIRSYNFQSSFGTWLGRITVNHCYDYLRRVRASRLRTFSEMSEEGQRQLEDGPLANSSETPSGERQIVARELVGRLLERAPADDRVILVLKEMEELSVEEIAEIMKLRPTTVKVRLHRARKRMLEDWKRWRGRK